MLIKYILIFIVGFLFNLEKFLFWGIFVLKENELMMFMLFVLVFIWIEDIEG